MSTVEKVTITIEILRYRTDCGEPVCDCGAGYCEWWDTWDEICEQTGTVADETTDDECPRPQAGCPVWGPNERGRR